MLFFLASALRINRTLSFVNIIRRLVSRQYPSAPEFILGGSSLREDLSVEARTCQASVHNIGMLVLLAIDAQIETNELVEVIGSPGLGRSLAGNFRTSAVFARSAVLTASFATEGMSPRNTASQKMPRLQDQSDWLTV